MRPAEFWARVVGRQLRTGIAACRATVGKQLLVNYAELPRSVVDRVAPFFGLQLSPAGIDRMRVASERSAKALDRAFVGDSELKRQSATPEIRAAVRRFAYEPFMELEDLRQWSLRSAVRDLSGA
jgi:hypothetical protein